MALLTLFVGLFFTFIGIYFLFNPKLQGARDVKFIESETVGSGERYAAYAGASVVIAIGLFFVYLGLQPL